MKSRREREWSRSRRFAQGWSVPYGTPNACQGFFAALTEDDTISFAQAGNSQFVAALSNPHQRPTKPLTDGFIRVRSQQRILLRSPGAELWFRHRKPQLAALNAN
jgi:hypothetical protein